MKMVTCINTCPLLTLQGRLGDVYDRKMFLILSYLMPAVGYVIIGSTSSFTLIILSRFINGERGTRRGMIIMY